jgi:peptidoglycan hydrolase-like protein with peptidoglycan-binding domain
LIRHGFVLAASVVAAVALTSAASAESQQPLLRLGSHGALVADWQRILNRWLLTTTDRADVRLRTSLGGALAEDGIFGPKTVQVTRRWQRGSQLAPTGVVGLQAWLRWIGSNVTCCGAGLPHFSGWFPWQPDAAVGWWQVALDRWRARHRLSAIVIDGVYGAETRSATALFQSEVGLPATGMAGRTTWLRMQRVHDALRIP